MNKKIFIHILFSFLYIYGIIISHIFTFSRFDFSLAMLSGFGLSFVVCIILLIAHSIWIEELSTKKKK